MAKFNRLYLLLIKLLNVLRNFDSIPFLEISQKPSIQRMDFHTSPFNFFFLLDTRVLFNFKKIFTGGRDGGEKYRPAFWCPLLWGMARRGLGIGTQEPVLKTQAGDASGVSSSLR